MRYLVGLGAAGIALRTIDADELGEMVDVVPQRRRHVAAALHHVPWPARSPCRPSTTAPSTS